MFKECDDDDDDDDGDDDDADDANDGDGISRGVLRSQNVTCLQNHTSN